MGMNDTTFMCTVKLYNVLKVKHALEKPVYLAICSVVFF
jgi:hypothetical protein